MNDEHPLTPHFRCGYVTIIGEPNVGKSTLLNGLLQQKISIVTDKPQTTRHNVVGILSTLAYQIIFLDTPGLLQPAYLLQEVMMGYASSAINDADIILMMIDATNNRHASATSQRNILQRLLPLKKPTILVINKSDAVSKGGLLPIIEDYAKAFPFTEVFPLSALTMDGTNELVRSLVPLLPEHPPLYPLDIASQQSERFFVAEIIREKIFEVCREEVPYSAAVEITAFKEREEGKSVIHAEITVERDSQKQIIIGKRGATLRTIGTDARHDIERFLQRPVYLDLFVKVRARWRNDGAWLARLGYTRE